MSPQSQHDEQAALAVLRPGWLRPSQELHVHWPQQAVELRLTSGSGELLSGPWTFRVTRDGQPVEPQGPWEEVCWLSDKDVDYLELEIPLAHGMRLQRHIVAARKDRFLLLADALLGPTSARLTYEGGLPLAQGVQWKGASQTREGSLGDGRPRAVVLPLALPEWRNDLRVGEAASVDGILRLQQAAEGVHLFAPLFIDLAPARLSKPLTWRQLTVAENRQNLRPDVAVGYRAMVGREQWLIYRSLAPRANRTLLGHNLSTEMMVGRFKPKGDVEKILEIEGPA